jgi:hypothetical protein
MTEFSFERDGWIDRALDDADESVTFTRLRIRVRNAIVSRNFSKRSGGESDAINVPLLPLATYIAKKWWQLLYEPLRQSANDEFQARHRLDTAMHGYVFPALALCSAGDESVLIDWISLATDYSPIEFRTSPPLEPTQIPREDVENSLMDLIEAALSRLSTSSAGYLELRQAWEYVKESMSKESELAYCMAAGRLGLDPYDPDAPDISRFSEKLDPKLFIGGLSRCPRFVHI